MTKFSWRKVWWEKSFGVCVCVWTLAPITFKLGGQLACKKTEIRAKFHLNLRHGSRGIRRATNSFGTRAFTDGSQTCSKNGKGQGPAPLQISAQSEQGFARNKRRKTAPIAFPPPTRARTRNLQLNIIQLLDVLESSGFDRLSAQKTPVKTMGVVVIVITEKNRNRISVLG